VANEKVHYALSTGTKIDDLGWFWTLSLNFQRISQDFADFGRNNS